MRTPFQVGIRRRKGTLHVNPRGKFDSNSAWTLIHKLVQSYKNEAQVIIDTGHLQDIQPFGCNTLQDQIDLSRIPRDRLMFTGAKGPALAPEGCQVKKPCQSAKCRCNGKCKVCHCRN